MTAAEKPPDHEHVWVFSHTYEDWWDGDEEDVYKCSVPGCTARQRKYWSR